jgi:hypothetical protein
MNGLFERSQSGHHLETVWKTCHYHSNHIICTTNWVECRWAFGTKLLTPKRRQVQDTTFDANRVYQPSIHASIEASLPKHANAHACHATQYDFQLVIACGDNLHESICPPPERHHACKATKWLPPPRNMSQEKRKFVFFMMSIPKETEPSSGWHRGLRRLTEKGAARTQTWRNRVEITVST